MASGVLNISTLIVLQLNLSVPQVCKLRLQDGRLAKEHLSELGRTLGQSLTVSDAVCRRTPENGYVGILVNDISKSLQ